MKASIITVGDEILIGQTIDTNSAFIAQQLNEIGVPVIEIMSVSDKPDHIENAIDRLSEPSDLIIMTGGLGPTNDDITKKVLARYFNDVLVENQDVLKRIEGYFSSLNRPMLDVHYQQALVPKRARIIENKLGTAPGIWLKNDISSVISLPGVPYEMKALIRTLLPLIEEEFKLEHIYYRTILFQGKGESTLAKELADFEQEMVNSGLGVAYLPSVGRVKIRLTGKLDQKEFIDDQIRILLENYPKHAFGVDDQTLESVIGDMLSAQNFTLGTVESCTGGTISSRIVSVPGSSTYYNGSIISYSNELKNQLAVVPADLIEKHGAVSQEVVEAMAIGGREALEADYVISTSGIAGPDGGTESKPVGTVWIGVAGPEGVYSKKFQFKHNRERNIESTVVFGLNFLRRVLLDLEGSENA